MSANSGAQALFSCVIVVAVGCASSSYKGASPPSPRQAEPTSMPASTSSSEPQPMPPPPPTSMTGATPTMVDDLSHAQVTFDQSAQAFSASSNDCLSLCKALGSMQRAADHLCELTKDGGDDDKKRCTDARSRLSDAKGRVDKTCGGCGPM